MKKLLLLSSAIFAFNFGAIAQTSAVGTPTVITDTLRYFLNKHQFKLGQAMSSTFPYYKAPANPTITTSSGVTHVGVIFRNSDPNLQVLGLEGYASKHNKIVNQNSEIRVHLYLCTLEANGLPHFPPVDSIITGVNNVCDNMGLCPPVLVAGTFTAGPRTMPGDFAVLAKNASPVAGDTVRFYRTSTLMTNSPNTSTATGSSYYKTGEGLGVIRRAGVWHKTANYTAAANFGGVGTDYEFCLAPRVQFTLTPGMIKPAEADLGCVFTKLTFTNTSSPEFTNRQFNLNEFYRYWKPFQASPESYFLPDSIIEFDFDDDDRLDTVPYIWGLRQHSYLSADGSNMLYKWYDTCGTFKDASMTARYRKMTTSYSTRVQGSISFSTSVDCCGGTVGINELNPLANVNVYPNPSANGKTTVSGLTGKNTISVYNVMGQLVSTEVTDKQNVIVDLAKQPAGSYMIRIVNSANKTKTVKVINHKE